MKPTIGRSRYARLLIGPAITIVGPVYVRTLFYAHGIPLDPTAVQIVLTVGLVLGLMATLGAGMSLFFDGD